MTDPVGLTGILVASLGGTAIGVERQWSGHASGSRARFGGVRTFTLLGGVAGIAGWLAPQFIGISIVLVTGAAGLVLTGYVVASRREIDATTEAAGLVVIASGFMAGLGWIALASGIVAISTLLLVEKSELHALVRRINNEELRAASLFGVMAIVVLPLLPEGPIDRFGSIKPRELWLLVLLFSGLSFIGYFARRIFGTDRGYQIAGLLAGLVSSTSATFAFARQSRSEPALARPLAIGAVAACTMLFPRVVLALLVLNVRVAVAILPYLVAPLVVGVAALLLQRRTASTPSRPGELSNPLQLLPALQMAVTFQVVLIAVGWARRLFGAAGLLTSGAVLGLMDVDALTVSMATSVFQGVTPQIAARAIAIGILVNCGLKTIVAFVLGARPFSRLAGVAVGTMAVVMTLSLMIVGR